MTDRDPCDDHARQGTLGRPRGPTHFSGIDHNGRATSSRAVVLAIDPASRTVVTRGGSDWAPYAQVHAIPDVEWADLETDDVSRTELREAVSARAAEGWTHDATLDMVDDPEQVRAMFTGRRD
jgi:hypothetical protein